MKIDYYLDMDQIKYSLSLRIGKDMTEAIIDALPEAEMELEFTASGGHPGKYSGPPEDCYPAEPIEIDWETDTQLVTTKLLAQIAENIDIPHLVDLKKMYSHVQNVLNHEIDKFKESDEAWDEACEQAQRNRVEQKVAYQEARYDEMKEERHEQN